jgi:hypothetical protein
MGSLRNWKHEKFAELVATGENPRRAYELAGYTPHRANHNKLLARPDIAARIDELKRDRALRACAARVPIEQILGSLERCGLDRLADFFERDAAGILRVRDLQAVPVEVSLALLRNLREGFQIPQVIVA